MKVGDMVVRAYAYYAFIPGIIIDYKVTPVEFDGDGAGSFKYDETSYVVAWSDGKITSELDVELDFLEDAFQDMKEDLREVECESR